MKINLVLFKFREISFKKSLMASEKGCKIPLIPTLLGPNRIWLKASNLRSNRVKKATTINKGISNLKIINIWLSNKKLIYWIFIQFQNFSNLINSTQIGIPEWRAPQISLHCP